MHNDLFVRLCTDVARLLARPARTLAIAGALAAPLLASAATAAPAGAVIGNQASATYSDASAVSRTVTSNTVVTTVQQIGSLTLTANGTKTISAGGQVYYPQTLANTGNGNDSFALSALQSGAMTFTSVQFYADANGDGVPDGATPITASGTLAPGQVFKFIVAGVVPSIAVTGTSNATTVTATSAFSPSTSASVVDTTTVSGQGVINVTQAIDLTAGPSPSNGRTVTITYTNTGNATATGVTLNELIPAGMTYVANSARWSVSGAGVTLTDANAGDNQGGIVWDYGVTSSGKPTAVIASVAPGTSGTVTFQVNVNSGLAPGALPATAMTGSFAYNDGASPVAASNTNTLQYTVNQTAALTFAGATVASAPQGGSVSFADTVTNTGNGADSFDIAIGPSTFPAGTTFQLFQADGLTPLQDANGNGIPDTGPMAAGAALNVVVKAVLPPGATGGPYTVQVVATSRVDPTKTATATDTLTGINGNAVDLTNDTVVPGATGVGAGPEASAVLTPTVNPGATLRFPLIVSNGSAVADAFDLAAATDSAFSAGLPAGWTVTFRDANGAIITTTGVLNAGASKAVFADVAVPANYAAGTTQLYFRGLSAATGASDRLHDAVTVNTLRSLVVTPNHTGQTTAGGAITYVHTVTNTGNVLEGDAVASTALLSSADAQAGFTTVVYWDKNNNGALDAADPVVTSLAQLTGGTNGANTTAGLAPGKSATLIVKVTAPASAAPGLADTTTLSVTVTGVIGGISAPAAAVSTDATTVVGSQVTLVTTQALDANCDGIADTALSVNAITAGALPNGCIRYAVTATNAGPAAITGLVVTNATPPLTTYHAVVPAATTIGTVTAPGAGAAGSVQATVGTLAPGQSAVLTFGVRITP
ncbi:MAG: hypothetical protein ABW032_12710 [Burkholderiaceae bacterium]